jgi:hypothetical protein
MDPVTQYEEAKRRSVRRLKNSLFHYGTSITDVVFSGKYYCKKHDSSIHVFLGQSYVSEIKFSETVISISPSSQDRIFARVGAMWYILSLNNPNNVIPNPINIIDQSVKGISPIENSPFFTYLLKVYFINEKGKVIDTGCPPFSNRVSNNAALSYSRYRKEHILCYLNMAISYNETTGVWKTLLENRGGLLGHMKTANGRVICEEISESHEKSRGSWFLGPSYAFNIMPEIFGSDKPKVITFKDQVHTTEKHNDAMQILRSMKSGDHIELIGDYIFCTTNLLSNADTKKKVRWCVIDATSGNLIGAYSNPYDDYISEVDVKIDHRDYKVSLEIRYIQDCNVKVDVIVPEFQPFDYNAIRYFRFAISRSKVFSNVPKDVQKYMFQFVK